MLTKIDNKNINIFLDLMAIANPAWQVDPELEPGQVEEKIEEEKI